MIDPERIGGIVGEALLAGALGALGAMARFSSADRPLLTRAYLLHALAGGSLGTGAWLIAHAFELDGWWLFAVAWLAGTLGYAALHDLLMWTAFGVSTDVSTDQHVVASRPALRDHAMLPVRRRAASACVDLSGRSPSRQHPMTMAHRARQMRRANARWERNHAQARPLLLRAGRAW